MKNIRDFLSENFQFLEVKISTYLNRRVFVMRSIQDCLALVTDLDLYFPHTGPLFSLRE